MSRAGRAFPRPPCRSRSTIGPGVSSGTRERILAAARELGWQPSASARALTEARTRAVGLVLARSAAQLEGDSFFLRFLSGIEATLTAADYALLLQIVPGEAATALPAYERLAAAGRVDGFLLTDVEADDPRFALLAAAAMPVVLAGRPIGPAPFPWLETRHDEGIAPAVDAPGRAGARADRVLLRAAGLRAPAAARDRVALGAGGRRARGRAGGARRARPGRRGAGAAARGADRGRLRVATRWRWRSCVAARALGLSVPDDVSVVGFDDSALAAFATPALTSVRVDYAEFGAAAAAALLAAIAGEPPPVYSPSLPELVVRASTALRRRR